MANYGIKVSKDGFDVKTADDRDLVMTSKSNLLKTKLTGVTTENTEVAHGLAYIPIFFYAVKPILGSDRYMICNGNIATGFDWVGSWIDATNFHSLIGRYYIFYQEL